MRPRLQEEVQRAAAVGIVRSVGRAGRSALSSYSVWTTLGFHGNPYDQAFLPGSEEGATLFCGRSAELGRLQFGIGSGGTHMSIEGDAGVGKTSLARVAGYEMFRQGARAADGTLFLPVPASIQLAPDPIDFERDVWPEISPTP